MSTERIDVEALRAPFNFRRCLMSAHALCPSCIKSHPDRMGWMGNYMKDQLRMHGFDVDSTEQERRARDAAVAELVEAASAFTNDDRNRAWHPDYRPMLSRLAAALAAAIQGAQP